MILLKKYWWVVVIILLVSALVQVNRMRIAEKAEKERVTSNYDNLSNEDLEKDRQFSLKKSEWKNWNDKVKIKVDSLEKANKILHRLVRSAEVIDVAFKDTTKNEVTHGTPTIETASETIKPLNPAIYSIPVVVPGYCWGMKGVITSTDPKSKLSITEKTANNSFQRLEIGKRFLGFLWPTKKSTYKLFTDCGEAKITNINFIK